MTGGDRGDGSSVEEHRDGWVLLYDRAEWDEATIPSRKKEMTPRSVVASGLTREEAQDRRFDCVAADSEGPEDFRVAKAEKVDELPFPVRWEDAR